MRVFKAISFFVYILFTACVVMVSVVLFQMSLQLENAPYATFLDTRYLVQQTESVQPPVPKGSVLCFKAHNTPYAVGEYVVYADEYDNTYLGEVEKYSDYEGLKTYEINTGTEVVTIAGVRVLGKADSYSTFYGVLAAMTATATTRLLVCVLPAALLVILLIVLICMMIFHRSANKAEVRTEEDEDLFVNLSRNRFLNQDEDATPKPKKPYYNPDAHMELLKYDWLIEAVEATDNAAAQQEVKVSAAIPESEPTLEVVPASEPESESLKVEPAEQVTVIEQSAIIEDAPMPTEYKIDPENVVSFSELDAEHQKQAKSKNETLIEDMWKILNKDD